MDVLTTKQHVRSRIQQAKMSGKTIGYVATMGFLHEGHLALVAEAKKSCDLVIMSIFVNPLQFGPNEDFERYPRNEKADKALAEQAGVDVLFLPSVDEMYDSTQAMTIHVTSGVDVLCGASRPGHFDGVAVVVMKLFQIIQPDKAYFGLKDAQQVAIIENMVKTFDLSVQIVRCQTMREHDGLAKSSRNVYLSQVERELAPALQQSLQKASEQVSKGLHKRADIIALIKEHLSALPIGKLDYVDVRTFPALQAEEYVRGEIIIALAYHFEKARLIDNVLISINGGNE